MELLKNFGFDPVLFVAQIVNFLIILFVLKRFLYKPILGMLKKREETVKEGLEQAETGRKLLEEVQVKEKEILKKARIHAEQIITDAKAESYEQGKKMNEDAKEQAQKLIDDANRQIELSEKETEKKLASYVSNLAIELLTKSSKQLFSAKEQKDITQNALKTIKQ